MISLRIIIYSNSRDLPEMDNNNFFHSKSLFMLYKHTPRIRPYMIVASTDDGRIVAHMIATIRYRTSLMPPYLYMHCRVMGEGEYHDSGYTKDEVFGLMLKTLTKKLQNRVFYIEFSNLSTKMFGYKLFRSQGYFPVHWMSIHNSLHSKPPEERLSDKMKKRIDSAYSRGVTTTEVDSDEDFKAFSRLLRLHNRFKPKRYIPDDHFFHGIMETGGGRLFVTKYKKRVIGCCACAYSEGNAYLWYFAFLRKSYVKLHPDIMTIWNAIKHAHTHGYEHIYFMDVGLPFQKNPFREFILRFGGKPVSTFRWFRFSISWLNNIISWIYRD